MTTVYAATGHRPEKLGGYAPSVEEQLTALAANYLREWHPDKVISGMALGWDMAWARAAVIAGIPFIAAVPFEGQESKWPQAAQQRYRKALSLAAAVEVVCPGGYAPWKMQKRNQWMVDNCTKVVALWDGSPGGTANCIAYANSVGVPIDNLWRGYLLAHKNPTLATA